MGAVQSLATLADFDKLVGSGAPVLVDFWGPWCKPCKALEPIIAELAAKPDGGLICATVNVQDAGPLAHALLVKSLPTLMVYRGGRLLARRIGAIAREKLLAWVDEALQEA